MSWSYSGNPANSTLDKCRFLIGDTDSTEPLFQDEEIQSLITDAGTNGTLLYYTLFMHAATRFARDIKHTLGPESEDPTERLSYFTARAAEYKANLVGTGLSSPRYDSPKFFRKGMFDNSQGASITSHLHTNGGF
jgi:hypothetical protein